jgi:hypothetical protein
MKFDNIRIYEWSNFQKVEEFGGYIINSNQYPVMDYIIRWSDDLQSIPKLQSIINNYKNKSNESYNCSKPGHILVIARPLLLISQKGFWESLMESYFKFVHPDYTLFSLIDFNPKTAPESLLSAIYFAGFVIQPSFPEEVVSYMNSYAINNIKNILFSVKLSSIQALGIYFYAFYLKGNSSLSRVCLSHFVRISHALGININTKNLSILEQYNRKLVDNKIRLYCNWAELGPSSYGLASEDDENDLDIFGPKYQFPNSNLKLCNNEFEGTLYSIFCCQFGKLKNLLIRIISKLCKHDSKSIKMEINELVKETEVVYSDAKLTLESVTDLAPEYISRVSVYLKMIRFAYITCILSIYSKMLETSKNRNYCTTQNILDKGIELWELISSNKIMVDIWALAPYIVGFHLIQAYPYCSKNQKKSIMFILKSIVSSIYKEGYNFNSMNFLILQTQLKLMDTN